MIAKLKELAEKFRSTTGSVNTGNINNTGTIGAAADSIRVKKRQDLIFWLVVVVAGGLMLLWLNYRSSATAASGASQDPASDQPLKLEVASKALDAEKMWRNHFEDKLAEVSNQSKAELQLIESSMTEQASNYNNQLKLEIDKLKSQIAYLTEEQAIAKSELSNNRLQQEEQQQDASSRKVMGDPEAMNIVVNDLGRGELFDQPKSSRNYIPETAYVSGILLDGLAVSTAMGSSSEPVPVVIRITSRGSLPENFDIDLKSCKILGSSYGDLSSERAIIRAEVLSCTDSVTETVYTTRIAGNIYGDDGMNGIKGKVVQTSNKHLKNAMIGGVISGFASSAKSRGSLTITGSGAINSKSQGFGEVLRDGGLEGASNAAEKIADYYIKQAESMSPILLIPSGSRVDVLFTKGVYFGASDVQEKLEQARGQQAKGTQKVKE